MTNIFHAVKRLFRHRHRWVDTGVNKWQITVEQKCDKCGEYRHHFMRDRFRCCGEDRIAWRTGKHPNPQDQK